jgi:hypothetical protein
MLNATWAMRIVTRPRAILSEMKNESSEAPTTTDGAAMSRKIVPSIGGRARKRR